MYGEMIETNSERYYSSLNHVVDSCRLNLKDDTKSMDPDQFHSVDCWPDYWFLRYI